MIGIYISCKIRAARGMIGIYISCKIGAARGMMGTVKSEQYHRFSRGLGVG